MATAFEARICAEDPENGFLPSVGRVDALTMPGGPGVRMDAALHVGMEITLFYDSLLGKLCVWGADRDAALRRMRQALSELKVADLKTNTAYLGRVFRNEEFIAGRYDTGLLERMNSPTPSTEVVEAAGGGRGPRRAQAGGQRAPPGR